MLGHSRGLLATARSQSLPVTYTLPKTQSSMQSKGWVGTKMGTVKNADTESKRCRKLLTA